MQTAAPCCRLQTRRQSHLPRLKPIDRQRSDIITPDHPQVDSGKRKYKIKGTANSHGSYESPVTWTMRAEDVVAGGAEHYVENIRAWARSIYEALKSSENLP